MELSEPQRAGLAGEGIDVGGLDLGSKAAAIA